MYTRTRPFIARLYSGTICTEYGKSTSPRDAVYLALTGLAPREHGKPLGLAVSRPFPLSDRQDDVVARVMADARSAAALELDAL